MESNKDGYRALVEEFNVHHFLEAAGFAGQAEVADAADEVFVELAGEVGAGGGIERGAAAAANIAIQGELRDRQN